ncbi:MAG: SusD/RagB family nutrient-binding outer membrane lipoprotein [Chlamydiia bacterium]|nr:SusD/RagB family nutrient-binding outer membrane lipoprotein [Chlamydiia bacterium]
MKKISLYIIALMSVFITTSCEKFLDVNDDKDFPVTAPPNQLLPAVLGSLSTSFYDHGETVSYFTQQVGTQSAWHKYKVQWDYVTANRIGQWRRHYHDIGVNIQHMFQAIDELEGKSADNYRAVGKIAYASSLMLTSDLFGDIAYTEAFSGVPFSTYDSQEYVYSEIDKMLGEAIVICDNLSGDDLIMDSSIDNVYGGDMNKWKAYAEALRARLAIHYTPNVSGSYPNGDPYDAAIKYANAALDDGFYEASYSYTTIADGGNADPSVAYQVNQWGPSKTRPSWDYQANYLDNSAPTRFMLVNALKYDTIYGAIGDPRTIKLIPGFNDLDDKFVVPGVASPVAASTALYESYVTQDEVAQAFMNKEELHFILAEAYHHKGNYVDAFSNFQDGVRINMERADTIADNYLASSFMPQEFTGGVEELTEIMIQKYIALWLQSEVWVDMRRHGYQDVYKGIERPKKLAYYWDIDDEKEWIQRLPYDTETEEIYNKPQLIEMGAYQNPEWLKKPMWWAKEMK